MTNLPVVPDSALDYDSDLVCTLDEEPFTGIAFEESAELGRSEITYRQGLQDGPAVDWYPSGRLRGESFYVVNVLHGQTKEYDEEGRLTVRASYEYGILVRLGRYDSSGAVVEAQEIDPSSESARLLDRLRSEHGWAT
jgi:antitoxin component YwqK of YwqJK toxin-antitoxin module